MCCLGYIVSKNRINNLPTFLCRVNSVEDIHDDKPFMIIGYSEAKEYFKERFNILNKIPIKNQFWTFKKTEKRIDYENDLEVFYNHILNDFISSVKYYYINVLNISFSNAKSLLNLFKSDEKKYIYIYGSMIYLLYKNDVIGVSIEILKYMGIDIKKVFSLLYSNKSNSIMTNDNFLDAKIKNAIKNKKYVVPYFMSMGF